MGRPIVDLTGQTFGLLTVLSRAAENYRKNAVWICQCSCGTVKPFPSGRLRSKLGSRSCGCAGIEIRRELLIARLTKHGLSTSRTYKIWYGMKKRCYNPAHKFFGRYGGRGITVCDEWLGEDGFVRFLGDMGSAPEGLSIDRIDNDDGYSQANCRWANQSEQCNNTSQNQRFTHDGKTLSIAQWARETGLPYNTLRYRLLLGKTSVEDSLTLPIQHSNNALQGL